MYCSIDVYNSHVYVYLGKHFVNITATFSQFFLVGQNTKHGEEGTTSLIRQDN